ncbi:hypothetical protein F383_02771 [Gossypium arboreum]|uniref:Uncharacterized protein n=1 Tax=Gossypium arboreum TaxID=29729 RepID=A0A0B0PQ03_GOSAR|nr:hypothetical protein F383_02771 [Gossypium arboreum]
MLLILDLSSVARVSFLMTINASPSTHISRKPISFAMVIACKHAFALAVVGSVIFSHG